MLIYVSKKFEKVFVTLLVLSSIALATSCIMDVVNAKPPKYDLISPDLMIVQDK
jgi:hypothetical protein